MCGICGVYYFDPQRHAETNLLHRMADQLIHRGPDEDGYLADGPLGFGFRRLSIIDVGGSHQPLSNDQQQVWLIFNGEIYNFQALRDQLESKYTFHTAGDSETIVHAYEEYGPRCVDHLRGMFAFAIWDSRLKRLMLAVDRFGKKPIYYLLDHEKLIFASELKSILQHPGVTREIDLEALDEYLAYGYINAPRSIFTSIRKVPPGHFLVVNQDGQMTLEEYWHPHLAEPADWSQRPLDDLAAELRGLLIEAVRLRMISDVPLGAFLSGGVDSSSVVALMSHVSTQPVKTFSIGFDESFYDETGYAQIVADYCHTDHTREVVRPDVVGVLPKLIHQFDEPFADSSMIPTYYVSQAARQHVTVSLSGDGGDEVFGGYPWYRYGFRHGLLQSFIPASLRPTASQVGALVPEFTHLRGYLTRVDQPVQCWGMYTAFFDPAARGKLYSDGAGARLGAMPGERAKQDAFAKSARLDWLGQLQYNDLAIYMPHDILVKVDRASMLASLEVRAPLLDHVVFEFMARVPSRYKLNLRDSKVLLKKALGNLLPPPIHTRPKQGFGIPIKEWLVGPLNALLRDTLLSPTARQRGLFETTEVEALIEQHSSGTDDHTSRLWALLCFELWACEYSSL